MTLQLLFLYSDPFGERLINNLVNYETWCQVCGTESCNKCRTVYPSHANSIKGIYELPTNLPPFIEDPEKYFPSDLPRVDIVIAVAVHHDLLASIAHVAKVTEAKAVIIPIENPQWIKRGLQHQISEDLEALGVEVVFPKPFCSLKKTGLETIDRFIDEFKLGYPILKTDVENGIIQLSTVERSAPCGCTWYVAQKIRFANDEELNEVISMAHHSYPCTASMINDRELKDTILHKAGYIARETVRKSLQVNNTKVPIENELVEVTSHYE
ncbi:MAG: DUF166 domain-containing protein [Candidatus Hodarchaeales archaeon]|jgi:hypothetical protein